MCGCVGGAKIISPKNTVTYSTYLAGTSISGDVQAGQTVQYRHVAVKEEAKLSMAGGGAGLRNATACVPAYPAPPGRYVGCSPTNSACIGAFPSAEILHNLMKNHQ